MRFWCLAIIGLLMCCACETAVDSPEAVVRQYSKLLSEGQLDQAQQLCTPAGAAYLVALHEVMAATESQLDTSPVRIEQLNCTITDSLAHCQSIENDGFETYDAKYQLRLTPQGWRIDQSTAEGETSSSQEILEPETDEKADN